MIGGARMSDINLPPGYSICSPGPNTICLLSPGGEKLYTYVGDWPVEYIEQDATEHAETAGEEQA